MVESRASRVTLPVGPHGGLALAISMIVGFKDMFKPWAARLHRCLSVCESCRNRSTTDKDQMVLS